MSVSEAGLRQLWADVVLTRDRHHRDRQGRAGSPELGQSREAALNALEEYVAALDERCWPVPPRLHQDLLLLRALCGSSRPPHRIPE